MKEKESKALRFGICDVLLIVFIVLKLTGVINWSWWIVTLPITIPIGIVLFITMMVGLFGIVAESKKIDINLSVFYFIRMNNVIK